ncbi:MAG: hypothetical protein CVV41_14555 [Candidatus Riflebacteria bacterium HGW-Riflebacteria-1]|jgi:ketosteroid isomerase-like protein|nr:MAG: hypothetical protein CVV41_14555 [Candidatus Riflebacteria bacterium HGW-Riflebacteria-1]
MKTLKKIFSLITIFGLLLVFAGCGGGGGSSDYTLSPEQLEVATFVDAFAAAIRRENLDETMQYVYSDLKYPNLTTSGYAQLKSRLETLFNKAVVDEFTITNMGVDVAASEDIATVRGLLTLKYSVDGSSKAPLSEEIELYLEKENSRWGIIQFAGRNTLMTTTFPPAL